MQQNLRDTLQGINGSAMQLATAADGLNAVTLLGQRRPDQKLQS